MTRRTCAICGERDASTVTDLDGRPVPACARCLAPVPDPTHPYEPADSLDPRRVEARRFVSTDHTTAETLIGAVARLGRPTFAELIDHLGITNHRENTLRATVRRNLTRLQARGVVAAEPINPAHRRAGCRYHLPERAAC